MKRSLLLLLLFLNSLFLSAQSWTQVATYAGQRTESASGFSVSGYGYIVGGFSPQGMLDDLWQYDPGNDSWTQKADFGGSARKYASAFTIGDTGYVCAGISSASMENDLWAYNPFTNSWTQKAGFPGTIRYGAISFSVGGYGYFGGGYDGSSTVNDFWQYDATADSWVQKASLPNVRWQGTSFATSAYGYVCTGFSSINGNYFYNDLRQYDPVNNNWTQKANFPATGRWLGVAFSIGDEGFVGLGRDGQQNVQDDFWQYHESTNTWSQIASYPGGVRVISAAFTIGECGYVGLGDSTKHGFDSTNTQFFKYCLPTPKGIVENGSAGAISIFISGTMLHAETNGQLIRKIMVYNISGQLLKQEAAHESKLLLDLSGIADGTYIVSVVTDTGIVNRKILLVR